MREFDATKAHFHHHHRHQTFKPSRYKLEAMKKIAECSAQRSSSSSPSSSWQMQSPVHTEDNSLLDAYEVERISNQLDYLLESSSSRLYSKYLDRDIYGQKSSNSTISSSSDIDYSTSSIRAMKKKNKKFLKGIWMRPTVVCGTRDDVDSRAFKGSQPRPPPVPGRHVPVVRMAICRRPRAAHV
ncbi:conserved hypothetical protein [Ricinus communis]|uniref:Uncharacterized protein n=2 Tax=Ricinus communis TaxID=3988 RepID=B9T2R4_RICCO|nr:conserved hypothetical protein [Ricinus communis]